MGPGPWPAVLYASAAVVVLTGVNLLGLREGKWTQNLLTLVKVLGLLAVVAVGFWVLAPAPAAATAVTHKPSLLGFQTAMIFVLLSYGGWKSKWAMWPPRYANPARISSAACCWAPWPSWRSTCW